MAQKDEVLPDELLQRVDAASDGRVRDATTGEAVRWLPSAMILPVAAALRQRLEGPEYERAAAESEVALHYEPFVGRPSGA